ncbi:arylsulfatase [Rhodoplanes sp. Z2-YC6860]|uniref:arylsulfatase n=1 Tax=Rhodoplanes sp. Z2-YC6860 TaxID=674703 RepID=UPI00078B3D76|nr:arylsulfatase [Rhodoplanes sp. Z2-YC6860]AMN43674.1 sulfatase [Rhodoplanes sp. Z2-YC6860]
MKIDSIDYARHQRHQTRVRSGLLGSAISCLLLISPVAAQSPATAPVVLPTDRTVLPIPEPAIPHSTVLDVREAIPPARFEVKAPAQAPNVLVVLIDDMGFGQSSAFGGPIHMPTVDQLANEGLRYNEFHTTALCSPTRAALLTGRNHHTNNMGSITETATAFPGQTGQRPNNVAPLAEMLRLNGYSTAAFGKSHETAAWEVSPSGPTDRWPTRSGFDKFYGFIGGETNQWAPLIYDGLSQVELPKNPNYHFMTDMTNQAIAWMQYQKSLTPDKPFFIYFAPGATHAPHHVPKEWIAKYKGKFDQGWDKLREETLARQIKLGVVPPGTKLAPKPEAIKDWAALSADEKRLFARQMEVFAGFAEYADTEIGRLVEAIKTAGQLDNTLVFYIVGDNGASAEGGMNGLFNEYTYFNQVRETVPDMLKHYDELGGPTTYNHYAAGWAVAGDTPFTWTKQVASSYGGTRNGMVIHWPKGISAKGELRSQWQHVIDIAPTILEAAGLPEPKSVNGTVQTPIEGTSFVHTFNERGVASRHTTQYFEIFGNRAIYKDGWLAGTVHRAAWEYQNRATFENDRWELYDARSDFSLVNDLAQTNPDKLKEMQGEFLKEAVKYSVLPLDDRLLERMTASLVGRPSLMAGRTSLTVHQGMIGMSENVFINLKNRSHTIIAELDAPKGPMNGAIVAQAGRFGGWSLYVKDGKPAYTYNWLGLKRFTITSKAPLPPGKSNLRFEFSYDGGGVGKGGTGTLFINDKNVGTGRIEQTQCCAFSADEGADVGADEGTPVTEIYKSPFKFNGKIEKVELSFKEMTRTEHQNELDVRKAATLRRGLSD